MQRFTSAAVLAALLCPIAASATPDPTSTPSPALSARYDKIWNGTAHREVCVQLRAGTATVHVQPTGYPKFIVYGSDDTSTIAHPTADGDVVVDALDGHDEPDASFNGRVCLGYALR